jgi:uncharacterized membrane protein
MIRILVSALCLIFAPLIGAAQTLLPALYDVQGVAVGDVLNIRSAPSANAAIIGILPRDATAVEVVALNADGKWAQVNTDGATGFVALRFLNRQVGADWGALEQPLQCIGTEPFWSLTYDPANGMAILSDPETQGRNAVVSAIWQNSLYRPTAAFAFGGAGFDGIATLRGAICSDGMSDTAYGIAVDLFLRDPSGASMGAFGGCCSMTP